MSKYCGTICCIGIYVVTHCVFCECLDVKKKFVWLCTVR